MAEDAEGGGYYPGKFTVSALKKAKQKGKEFKENFVNKQRSQREFKTMKKEVERNAWLMEDEALESESGAAMEAVGAAGIPAPDIERVCVGNLSVSQFEVRSVRSCIYQTYIRVGVESQREMTPSLDKLSEGGCGAWPEKFSFDITDVGADLFLSVYGKPARGPFEFKHIGKVIIPLTRLYNRENVPALLGLREPTCSLSKNVFTIAGWFQLYPLDSGALHFEPAIQGIPGTGMERKGPLGEVHVQVSLNLTAGSVAFCSMLNSPWKPVGSFEKETFQPQHIKLGVLRMKYIALTFRESKTILLSLHTWEHPLTSFIALVWFTYTTMIAPSWQYPFLCSSMYVYLSYCFPSRTPDISPIVWNDEIEKDPNLPDTIGKKLKAIKSVLFAIQTVINKVAFRFERMLNSTNWVDSTTTIVFSAYLLLFSAFASVLVAFLQLFFRHVIPLHAMFFVAGILFFCPFVTDSLVEKVEKSTAASAQNDAGRAPHDTSPMNQRKRRFVQLVRHAVLMFSLFFDNVLCRIPDAKELIHRHIAQTQELNDM